MLAPAIKSIGNPLAAAISGMRDVVRAIVSFLSSGESIAGFLPKNLLCCRQNMALVGAALAAGAKLLETEERE